MRRRRFVTGLLVLSALALPALRAQQQSRLRRITVLMLYPEKDPEGQTRARAFRDGLQAAGWQPGKTIAIDFLWGAFDADWMRTVTGQLQQLAPDVIVVNSSTGLRAIEKIAGVTPIVFISVSEPVPQGFVASLAHPGGTMTGLSNLEPTLGAKWVDLFREAIPAVKRIAFLYNPGNPGSKVTPVPRGRRICRSHPQGREARRHAGAAADKIRNDRQSQEREDTRHRRAHDYRRARR
jgi:putative tryptophan/tyrosine transport system substrate-binding protein